MAGLSRLRSLWRNLVHRDRVERELDAELRATFEALEEEHVRSGMSGPEARRAATLQLGRVQSLKEQVHDVKAGAFVESWIQDVRYALRLLRRGPLFAALCHRVAGARHRRHRRHLLPVRRHRAAPAQCARARPPGRGVVGKARPRPIQLLASVSADGSHQSAQLDSRGRLLALSVRQGRQSA